MVSILASVFVFGILVFIHEFGHFLLAKKNGVRVEKFSFGFGRKLWGRKIGQTEYLISAVPLGGYIKMAGDEPGREPRGEPFEFLSKTCGQRAQIIAGGPILNFLLAFFIFSFLFIIGIPTVTTRVGNVLDDYPAKAAGIRPDDVILAVDGEGVEYWQEMAQIIYQKTEGSEIVLDVQRDKELIKIKLVPKLEEYDDTRGQKVKIGLIGIHPAEEKYSWGESFYEGGKKLVSLTGFTYKALWRVLTLRLPFKETFAGPIFIFKLTGDAARMGFVPLLSLMGLFSMCLAIFNFLPIPVLDGGHLLFLILEKLRRKPIGVRTQEIATQVGMMLLIALILFVSYNDLLRLDVFEKLADWWGKIGPK